MPKSETQKPSEKTAAKDANTAAPRPVDPAVTSPKSDKIEQATVPRSNSPK
jgi:hypothetical protein